MLRLSALSERGDVTVAQRGCTVAAAECIERFPDEINLRKASERGERCDSRPERLHCCLPSALSRAAYIYFYIEKMVEIC